MNLLWEKETPVCRPVVLGCHCRFPEEVIPERVLGAERGSGPVCAQARRWGHTRVAGGRAGIPAQVPGQSGLSAPGLTAPWGCGGGAEESVKFSLLCPSRGTEPPFTSLHGRY